MFAEDKSTYTTYGVTRGCGTAKENKCLSESGLKIPELGVTTGTGTVCYCTGDLCNFSPPTSGRRMAVTFTVTSLLALAAARFLIQ